MHRHRFERQKWDAERLGPEFELPKKNSPLALGLYPMARFHTLYRCRCGEEYVESKYGCI